LKFYFVPENLVLNQKQTAFDRVFFN